MFSVDASTDATVDMKAPILRTKNVICAQMRLNERKRMESALQTDSDAFANAIRKQRLH